MTIILTQYQGAFLGPIAKLLGLLMNGIFEVLYKIGIPNIGLSIILFTLIIYLLLMPLTVKQQKFSKLSAKMNPELEEIRKKYNGKKDNDSMMRMNEETKAVYAKYGVSPSGSCVQLIIQMPILFALYRVIDNIPAYVTKVKDIFIPFVDKFIADPKAVDFIQNKDNFANVTRFTKQFSNELFVSGDKTFVSNTFIDVLNKANSSEWANIYAKGNFESLKELITNSTNTGAFDLFEKYNNFLGLNIADSPQYMLKSGFATHSWGIIIGAILVPVLAALTQWLNVKLTPQANNNAPTGNSQADTMAQSMKTMNIMMPLMSAWFCFSLPSGMGLYWIAGAVIRCFQQVGINKYIDREDIDAMIKKNQEKIKKKEEKRGGSSPSLLEKYANMSTKSMTDENKPAPKSIKDKAASASSINSASASSNNYKPGSLAAKANLVKEYNENKNS